MFFWGLYVVQFLFLYTLYTLEPRLFGILYPRLYPLIDTPYIFFPLDNHKFEIPNTGHQICTMAT